MNWDAAIEIHRTTLQRLLAVMFAALSIEVGGAVEVVTERVRLTVLRILGPAESAVRRLVLLRA